MPNKATVSGVMVDANLSPIVGGKVVATFVGTDIFDDGVRIVPVYQIDATTDDDGEWSLDLIVNAEGESASTSWTIEGFKNTVGTAVFSIKGLFIASSAAITLGDLEKISASNLAAAKSAALCTLFVVNSYAEYTALPAAQKSANDVVLVVAA